MRNTGFSFLIFLITLQQCFAFDPWQAFKLFDKIGTKDYSNQYLSISNYRFYAANYAWHEKDNLNAFIDAFMISGDTKYLDRTKARIHQMLKNMDSNLSVPSYVPGNKSIWPTAGIDVEKSYPVWRFYHQFSSQDTVQGHLLSAYILNPLARFCALAGQLKLSEENMEFAKMLADTVDAVISHLDTWAYKERDKYAYYIDYPPNSITAWNYMAQAALVHLYLSQSGFLSARDSLLHLDKATRIAGYFKSQLIKSSEKYIWKYYPNEKPLKFATEPFWYEDTSHGASEVEMVSVFHRYGLVFDNKDIVRFQNTLNSIISDEKQVSAYVNGFEGYPKHEQNIIPWRQFEFNSMVAKNALANWAFLSTPGRDHFNQQALLDIYEIAFGFSGYKTPGTAHLHFMSKLSLIMMPKNMNFGLQNKTNELFAYWTPFGSGTIRSEDFLGQKTTSIQKKVTNDQVGFYQTIPCHPELEYKLLVSMWIEATENSTGNVFVGFQVPTLADSRMQPVSDLQHSWETASMVWSPVPQCDQVEIVLSLEPDFIGKVYFNQIQLELEK